MFRRLWILDQIADRLNSFDSAYIDECLSHCRDSSFLALWNSTKPNPHGNNQISPAVAQCRWLYLKFQPFLPSFDNDKKQNKNGDIHQLKELELVLEAMKKLLFDCRTEDRRQTKAEIELDDECRKDLGYSPYQIRGMETSELLDILKAHKGQ